MKTSDSLANLAPALVKASAELRAITKDSTNPHFRSTYASLDTIIDTVRPVLAKHGLTVVQGANSPHTDEAGRVTAFTVETMLLHASGEYLSNAVIMPMGKADPQGAGAAVTYGRRYALSALLSLATEEDDDGNAAMPSPQQRAQQMVQSAQSVQRAPRTAPTAPTEPTGPLAETVQQVTKAATAGRAASADNPACPECGGPMWDNRAKKAAGEMNAKAPDFKCRRKGECEGVIWPPKAGRPGSAPARAAGANTTARSTMPSDDFNINDYAPDDDLPF